MTKPITPNEIVQAKRKQLPDFVIEAFNEQLAKKLGAYTKGSATIRQKDIIEDIIKKAYSLDEYKTVSYDTLRAKIFEGQWLDIEEVYHEAGWNVYYDKPGYNEDYDAYWKFRAR